jgi:hypothetical protein
MSTYYFNVRCEHFQRTDLVGEECDSLDDIRSEALRTARELVTNDLLSGRFPQQGWIEVEDEEHRPVLMLPISAAAS